ncbi:hypothetical protein [Halococcus thailandensis]|uniref:hypothetical protein n=1 Tax=Halococcus thailandensis TaxID=335952 RepID=UPI0012687A31|nr:hypothetical protein [Halococcus thailandensis]
MFGGFRVVSVVSPNRLGFHITELLLNVDDVLDDVSTAGFGAFEFALEFVVVGFGIVNPFLEPFVRRPKFVVLSCDRVKLFSLTLAIGFEFGNALFESDNSLEQLFVGLYGCRSAGCVHACDSGPV